MWSEELLDYDAQEFFLARAEEKFSGRREIDFFFHVALARLVHFHGALLDQAVGVATRIAQAELNEQQREPLGRAARIFRTDASSGACRSRKTR